MSEAVEAAAVFDPLRPRLPPEVVSIPSGVGNVGLTYSIGGDYWQRLDSISVLLTADANAANRVGLLTFRDQDAIAFAQYVAPFKTTASNASRLTFAVGAYPAGADDAAAIVTGMAPYLLLPGWSVKLTITAGVAGDTLTAARIYRQRYLTGPQSE